jgi:hypothetical protein
MSRSSRSFDATSSAFHVRKLSTVSQNIFQGSFDVASPKGGKTLDTVDAASYTPKTSRDMQIQRRIACCHFTELVFFMFAFLLLIWLHEVSTINLSNLYQQFILSERASV